MDYFHSQRKPSDLLAQIREFVARSKGLSDSGSDETTVQIQQTIDGKTLSIHASALEDVFFRTDAEGQDFIQVNFSSGHKILMTDTLIGFKPSSLRGLDMAKLPKVVTTPDIISVHDAIQEALHGIEPVGHDVALLRKVFESVISGGEAVGFDLSVERAWLRRIMPIVVKVTA